MDLIPDYLCPLHLQTKITNWRSWVPGSILGQNYGDYGDAGQFSNFTVIFSSTDMMNPNSIIKDFQSGRVYVRFLRLLYFM